MATAPNFSCRICGAEFSTREQLEAHEREAHGERGRRQEDAEPPDEARSRTEPLADSLAESRPRDAGEVF